jgi:hypothetical protein
MSCCSPALRGSAQHPQLHEAGKMLLSVEEVNSCFGGSRLQH